MKRGRVMEINSYKHVFSICAYKESEYLEECVLSLINQRLKSEIIICTSTPCDYIDNIAQKYDIPLFVREGKSDIKDDWNFAYNCANGNYVTIAHQDDVYDSYYSAEVKKNCSENKDVTMFLSDYLPLKNGNKTQRDINSKLRRFLRSPLKNKALAKRKSIRKITLAFGNSICCPSVTYNKGLLGDSIFTSSFKFCIDWDTFLKLAKIPGAFVYVDKPLILYRVHDDATSKAFIENNGRIIEDTEMFRQFWPEFIVKILMRFYRKAYDTYSQL